MSQREELKRLAEAALAELADLNHDWPTDGDWFDCQSGPEFEYLCAANPAVIKALIAENERLRESDQEATELCDTLSVLLREVAVAVRGPEEPKSRHGFHDLPSRVKTVVADRDQLKAEMEKAQLIGRLAYNFDGYKAVLDERDQLRAEIAGLKTGYQAYERVNAELKAEVERLDNALSVTDTAAQKWLEERTGPQAALAEARELFGSILDNPRLVLGMPSALLVGIKDFLSSQSGRAGKGKGEQP